MNTSQKEIYICSRCGIRHFDEFAAEYCCARFACEDCGRLLSDDSRFTTVCDYCLEDRKVSQAKKVSLAQYLEQNSGFPLFTPDGAIVHSEEEIKDWNSFHEGSCPNYFYGSKRQYLTLDGDKLVELLYSANFDEQYDPLTAAAYEDLYAFCEKWNATHKSEYFVEDPLILVSLLDLTEDVL